MLTVGPLTLRREPVEVPLHDELAATLDAWVADEVCNRVGSGTQGEHLMEYGGDHWEVYGKLSTHYVLLLPDSEERRGGVMLVETNGASQHYLTMLIATWDDPAFNALPWPRQIGEVLIAIGQNPSL